MLCFALRRDLKPAFHPFVSFLLGHSSRLTTTNSGVHCLENWKPGSISVVLPRSPVASARLANFRIDGADLPQISVFQLI